MKVKEYLIGQEDTNYFIVDTHQGSNGLNVNEYAETDFSTYEYKLTSNRKIKNGSIFLYRRPGTSTRNHKFYIYGGGVFGNLVDETQTINVSRRIVKGFRLESAIHQDDQYMEEFNWKFKERKPNSGWRNFFTQYGITEIKKEDFFSLVGDLECTAVDDFVDEEENAISTPPGQFTINYTEGNGQRQNSHNTRSHRLVVDIDFNDLNRRKKDLGTAGELLVMREEIEKLKRLGIDKQPEYVANTIGDGLGYDILSYDEQGNPIYIEVKTTRTGSIDGFFMSQREVKESLNRGNSYRIYRVYKFDDQKMTANIHIYIGPVCNSVFLLEPTEYRVFIHN